MLAIEPAGLALVLFGSVIFGIRNRPLQDGKQLFHCNPALRLIMHFLRAAIFSIATLAFMASASATGSSELCPLVCYNDSDCGGNCYCARIPNSDVSSLSCYFSLGLNFLVITLHLGPAKNTPHLSLR